MKTVRTSALAAEHAVNGNGHSKFLVRPFSFFSPTLKKPVHVKAHYRSLPTKGSGALKPFFTPEQVAYFQSRALMVIRDLTLSTGGTEADVANLSIGIREIFSIAKGDQSTVARLAS